LSWTISTDGSASWRDYGAVIIKNRTPLVAARNKARARGAGRNLAFGSDHEIDRHWIETALDAIGGR
jgi:hypothetical protein